MAPRRGRRFVGIVAAAVLRAAECTGASTMKLRRDLLSMRMAVVEWIEGWYNTRRCHSSHGYRSPNDFETRAEEALMTAGT